MIFVIVGTQKFNFNRLLMAIDALIEKDLITMEVFAQTGHSDYCPKHYRYAAFFDRIEFNKMINKSSLIITHGGAGAIVSAVRSAKKTIAVPRLQKFGEHVDDHQLQIVQAFEEMQLIQAVYDIGDLANKIQNANRRQYKAYVPNTDKFLIDLEGYIDTF